MAKSYDLLNDQHIEFIRKQKLFFVATAPLSPEGSVNLSPKGYDSIAILDSHTVAWVDLGGSGIETLAHLRENSRITLMFCAFEGAANILRIYGRGEAISFDNAEFSGLMKLFPAFDRARSIIRIRIDRVSDSCGWGVPFFEFKEEREQLQRWVDNRPYDEWKEHRYKRNEKSVDGLPGLVRPSLGSEGGAS
ncbi:MAG: pyridoxamine 5'-phosphate oxidase family protein [Pseudomonadota bacterium]